MGSKKSDMMNPGHDPSGISRVHILYSMAQTAQQLEAFKLARWAYDKLQMYTTPDGWMESIELSIINLQSKPFSDRQDLLPVCARCFTTNPMVNNSGTGDRCTNCGHPFIRAFLSYDVLSLVEFSVECQVTDYKARQLIEQEPSLEATISEANSSSGYTQHESGVDRWSMDDVSVETHMNVKMNSGGRGNGRRGAGQSSSGEEAFSRRVADFKAGSGYKMVEVDESMLAAMDPSHVFILQPTGKGGVNSRSKTLPCRYVRTMTPDVDLTLSISCNTFFHTSDFEFEYLKQGCCPCSGDVETGT